MLQGAGCNENGKGWPWASSLIEALFDSTGDPTTYAEVNMKWRSDRRDSTPKTTHTGTAILQDTSHFLIIFYHLYVMIV